MEYAAQSPHHAAALSAIAASASVVSWATDHAVLFTLAAAVTAIISGISAIIFYSVSVYYKIKYENSQRRLATAIVDAIKDNQ